MDDPTPQDLEEAYTELFGRRAPVRDGPTSRAREADPDDRKRDADPADADAVADAVRKLFR